MMPQKLRLSLAPMIVPITTSMPQNGRMRDTNASDSPKARTNTMGAAHSRCRVTNALMASVYSANDMSSPSRSPFFGD